MLDLSYRQFNRKFNLSNDILRYISSYVGPSKAVNEIFPTSSVAYVRPLNPNTEIPSVFHSAYVYYDSIDTNSLLSLKNKKHKIQLNQLTIKIYKPDDLLFLVDDIHMENLRLEIYSDIIIKKINVRNLNIVTRCNIDNPIVCFNDPIIGLKSLSLDTTISITTNCKDNMFPELHELKIPHRFMNLDVFKDCKINNLTIFGKKYMNGLLYLNEQTIRIIESFPLHTMTLDGVYPKEETHRRIFERCNILNIRNIDDNFPRMYNSRLKNPFNQINIDGDIYRASISNTINANIKTEKESINIRMIKCINNITIISSTKNLYIRIFGPGKVDTLILKGTDCKWTIDMEYVTCKNLILNNDIIDSINLNKSFIDNSKSLKFIYK